MNRLAYIILLLLFSTIECFSANITFADVRVKFFCVQNWDTDGDGELSEEEAASVKSLANVFSYDTAITSFNELVYFTGIKSLNEREFYTCTALESITLPPNVTTLADNAFYGCTNLKTVNFNEGLNNICNFVFNGCTSLESPHFPSTLTTIGEYSFSYCSSITSLKIPAALTNFYANTFWSCYGITKITVDEGNTVYDSRDGSNAIINTKTNTLTVGCKSTEIPSTVTKIGDGAFYGCYDLTSITIPTSVTAIGVSTFNSCIGLTAIDIPSSVATIDYGAFNSCTGLTSVILPEGVKTIGPTAFMKCTKLSKVSIPASVTSIQYQAFAGCDNLTKVAMTSPTPPSIDASIFTNCRKATLYVPQGCRMTYRYTANWRDFHYIAERGISFSASISPTPAAYNENPSLDISIANDDFDTYTSIQMDITLPEDIDLKNTAEGISHTFTSRVPTSGLSFSISRRGNGKYRIKLSHPTSCLNGTDGSVASFGLTISPAVDAGDYEGLINSVVLTTDTGTDVTPADAPFTISVVKYQMGDVNHDGSVSLVDVMALVNYILGISQENIYLENGDMDNDGNHGVTDVTMIVNVILNN